MLSTSLALPLAAEDIVDPVAKDVFLLVKTIRVSTCLVMKNFSAIALEYAERTVLYGWVKEQKPAIRGLPESVRWTKAGRNTTKVKGISARFVFPGSKRSQQDEK